jgi:hypothetical protein
MDRIDGLTAGDPVTAEQRRALFGCGLHALAELGQQQLEGPDLVPRDFQELTQLGVPFRGPQTVGSKMTNVCRTLGLWVDLCVVTKAANDEQPDRFGPGAPMVSSVGVDSGQEMSQAYLYPTTDFRPTGSPFVR